MNGWIRLGVWHQVEFDSRDDSFVLLCDNRRRILASTRAIMDYRCVLHPRCQHPACQATVQP